VLGFSHEQGGLAVRHPLGPLPVEDPPSRRGQQPRGRVVRWAGRWPAPRRGLDGVAEGVLNEVEPAVLRKQQRRQPPPLLAHDHLEDGLGSPCHTDS